MKRKTLQEQDLNAPVSLYNFQNLLPIPLIPTVSTLCSLLEQQTPTAEVYSRNQPPLTSLYCEPCHPHLSCVNPWIRLGVSIQQNIRNLHALCQPLDKAVTCKLQVSMTWALKPSDKAVTANSESAFSVRELNSPVIANAGTV